MRKENTNIPSAPIESEEQVTEAPRVTPQPNVPYPTLPPTYGSTSGQPNNPPSYEEAIQYPAVDQMPKPVYSYPSQNMPQIQPLQAPYPPPPNNPQHNSQPQIIHTTVTTIGLPTCIWCRQGTVRNETDLCCLICLIILAICTFPFGLVLLCCIPCTVRPRCTHCRRLQD